MLYHSSPNQIIVNERSNNRVQNTAESTLTNTNAVRATSASNRRYATTNPEAGAANISSPSFLKRCIVTSFLFITPALASVLAYNLFLLFNEKRIDKDYSYEKRGAKATEVGVTVAVYTFILEGVLLTLLYTLSWSSSQQNLDNPPLDNPPLDNPPSYENYKNFPLVQSISINPLSNSTNSVNTLPNYEKAINRFPAVKEAALQNRGLNPSSSDALPDTSSVSIEMQPLTLETPPTL